MALSAWNRYVKSYAKKHPSLVGKSLFKKAASSYRKSHKSCKKRSGKRKKSSKRKSGKRRIRK